MASDMESENSRKMFIGGLHYETTDESLQAFYQKWGEVVDVVVMRDSMTKRSRGFGFITYARAHMVDEALKAKPHVIDGKQVDPKRATPKEELAANPVARASVKKVFVGGIREVTENSDLIEYFSQFGTVVSADIALDKTTGRKRGFAFVSFDDWDAVDKCTMVHSHSINGNPCEVKKAVERDSQGGGSRGGGRGGGPVGGRGGRGGGGGGSQYGSYGGQSAGGYGAYGSGGGEYAYGASAYGNYGASPAGYGASPGGWGQPVAGYSDGYGAGFGSGYGNSNGGGAMKSAGGYAQRSAGPYAAAPSGYPAAPAASAYGSAGDYGAYGAYGAAASSAYGGASAYGNSAAAYGSTAGGYGAYGQS